MKYFVDVNIKNFDPCSAKSKELAETDITTLDEITKLAKIGKLGGVNITTPPLTKEDRFYGDIYEIMANHSEVAVTMIVGDFSDEITIQERGIKFNKINKNIIATAPFTQEGLCACKALTEQEIKVNVALCYSTTQALQAAEAGATYISIPADQLENTNDDGIPIIQDICDIYKKQKIETQILLTSIESSEQVEQAASIGVHAVATPSSIFWKLYQMIQPIKT